MLWVGQGVVGWIASESLDSLLSNALAKDIGLILVWLTVIVGGVVLLLKAPWLQIPSMPSRWSRKGNVQQHASPANTADEESWGYLQNRFSILAIDTPPDEIMESFPKGDIDIGGVKFRIPKALGKAVKPTLQNLEDSFELSINQEASTFYFLITAGNGWRQDPSTGTVFENTQIGRIEFIGEDDKPIHIEPFRLGFNIREWSNGETRSNIVRFLPAKSPSREVWRDPSRKASIDLLKVRLKTRRYIKTLRVVAHFEGTVISRECAYPWIWIFGVTCG